MSLPLFMPGFGYQVQPKSTIIKNTLLAGVSTLTYAATQLGCSNSDIVRDSLTFGVSNGLAQEFFPKIVQNENLQSLFIDPLVASVFQGIVKMLIYGDSTKIEYVIAKSIVAGISASALTLHIHDGTKKY